MIFLKEHLGTPSFQTGWLNAKIIMKLFRYFEL